MKDLDFYEHYFKDEEVREKKKEEVKTTYKAPA